MKNIKSIIKLIFLVAITNITMVAISSTTRVSCEGNVEKSTVSGTSMADKKSAKSHLTILFTNDKAILPGAVLSCLHARKQ